MLERIEQTIAAVKTKIINDEDVRKLLFHDSNNALNMLAPTVLETDSYITTKPVYEFENKNEYNQNSMVNIYMIEIVPTDDVKAFVGALQVNVTCNLDIWDLLDNKIRPIQICDRIIKLVHNQKFYLSNKLRLTNVTDLIVNKKMVGYALLFEITDGSGTQDKF